MSAGITVQCVYCDARKTIPFDEARRLDGPPLCEKDGGPMIAVSASMAKKGKRK